MKKELVQLDLEPELLALLQVKALSRGKGIDEMLEVIVRDHISKY